MEVRRPRVQNIDFWRDEPKPRDSEPALPTRDRVIEILSGVFLPQGYPNSVRPDYARYQIFDSLQAFCSSIAGLFASRAVLEGFGVGDENASPTNAVLLSVFQDAAGRLATILFAWRFSSVIAPEVKTFRLAADLFNDSALAMDCLTPTLPQALRAGVLCLTGAFRALCGVCAGASKASLSAHFAKTGNVAELNAKDASQETVVGLLGTLFGSFLMSHVTSKISTWVTLAILLIGHISFNYLAVRAVALNTLNKQRLVLLLHAQNAIEADDPPETPSSEPVPMTSRELTKTERVKQRFASFRPKRRALDTISTTNTDFSLSDFLPTPGELSKLERIFYRPDALRDSQGRFLSSCSFCASHGEVRDAVQRAEARGLPWTTIEEAFRGEHFVLVPTAEQRLSIIVKEGAKAEDRTKAWMAAYRFAENMIDKGGNADAKDELKVALLALGLSSKRVWKTFVEQAERSGWDISTEAICTGAEWLLPDRMPSLKKAD